MTSPLRVAMYADAYEDYVPALARPLAQRCALRVLYPASWDGSSAGHTRAGDFAGIDGERMELPRVRDPRRLLSTHQALGSARRNTDVLHIQQSGDPWFSLLMTTPRRHRPTVVTIHDALPHPGDGSQIPGGNALQHVWSRRVDRFIVHAPAVAEDLVRLWRVPADRIHVIDHPELGTLYRSRVGTVATPPREPATVLFYGRRYAYKGLPILVDAMRRLAGSVAELRLIIAGAGDPLPPAVAALAAEVAVEVHDGRVHDHATIELFARATVTCLPYLEASQSGVAALAVGLGTPVVASDVGGIARLVHHGVQGVLAPSGDAGALANALASVLAHPERHAAMQAACLARAATDLLAEHIAEATLAVYQQAAGV